MVSVVVLIAVLGLGLPAMAALADAHPMGNFSISHYTGLSVTPQGIELRYLVDLAEIPTFQEIQESGIVAEAAHPTLDAYLARKAADLKAGLALDLNGQRVDLQTVSSTVLFTPGAGDLPTMKLGLVYRATVTAPRGEPQRLTYRDGNFPGRAGWKEVVARPAPGVALVASSVPEQDRSRQLTDYPTDLLNGPPQTVEAALTFALQPPPSTARVGRHPTAATAPIHRPSRRPPEPAARPDSPAEAAAGMPLGLEPNRQAVRRDRFADVMMPGQASGGIVALAALAAAVLGAFHALEPGHGKTVVAAYLIGSRGTARHAMLLGLIVTASHTAGVYLLGAVTLYASRHVVPERLYPWLGALSGLTIAALGCCLCLRRYAAGRLAHEPAHTHEEGDERHHGHRHPHHAHDHHHRPPGGTVSFRELLALGVTGGIVPCPAALVVLLSAVALHRVGLGLFLIVAFSAGLALVLIAIGLLMVYARRLMARVDGNGPLITRWLPLASSATITVLGVAIAVQALVNAGVLVIRLG